MTINQNYYSQKLSLMYEIKTEDVYDYFSSNKEIIDFSNIRLSQHIIIQTN